MNTFYPLLGLLNAQDFFVTVEHSSLWRRHLAWAMGGEELRNYLTQRYSSSMVFMSLLLSAELSVLFNGSDVLVEVRKALSGNRHGSIYFWPGVFIILSLVLTILGLLSTFTAWAMVSAINKENAHSILRSSIGQYAGELPGRFIVGSLYLFLVWVIMLLFLLLPPGFYLTLLTCLTVGLFVHTIMAFSSFGRIIMHSGAMGSHKILDSDIGMSLSPRVLHQQLLSIATANLKNHASIRRQYQTKLEPMKYPLSEEEWTLRIKARLDEPSPSSVASSSTSPESETDESNHSSKQTNSVGSNDTASPEKKTEIPNRRSCLSSSYYSRGSKVFFADGLDNRGNPVTLVPNDKLVSLDGESGVTGSALKTTASLAQSSGVPRSILPRSPNSRMEEEKEEGLSKTDDTKRPPRGLHFSQRTKLRTLEEQPESYGSNIEDTPDPPSPDVLRSLPMEPNLAGQTILPKIDHPDMPRTTSDENQPWATKSTPAAAGVAFGSGDPSAAKADRLSGQLGRRRSTESVTNSVNSGGNQHGFSTLRKGQHGSIDKEDNLLYSKVETGLLARLQQSLATNNNRTQGPSHDTEEEEEDDQEMAGSEKAALLWLRGEKHRAYDSF